MRYFLGCKECRVKVLLWDSPEAYDTTGRNMAKPVKDILAFISKHRGCKGGVMAEDDTEPWISQWADDDGRKTKNQIYLERHRLYIEKYNSQKAIEDLNGPTFADKQAIFHHAQANTPDYFEKFFLIKFPSTKEEGR